MKNLNDILEDFLSLGKLDEGKVVSQITEINLKECIEDTIDEMKPFAKKDQHFEQSFEGSEMVYSDKKLFRNIIINLVSNAIKFPVQWCFLYSWYFLLKKNNR